MWKMPHVIECVSPTRAKWFYVSDKKLLCHSWWATLYYATLTAAEKILFKMKGGKIYSGPGQTGGLEFDFCTQGGWQQQGYLG